MKNATLLILSLSILITACNKKAEEKTIPPLVYEVENTGANFKDPVLPKIEDLTIERTLTDPFAWSNGSGRSTDFKDWEKRRNEIKAEIEHYGIGEKPDKPENITASFANDTLTVNITVNDSTLTLTAAISLPKEGQGPFPAVIGIGRGSGSLPADIFENRNIATIAYNFSQVMAHTQKRGTEPINKLYPDLTYMGAYSAWSWGVSRIIDGLELVSDELKIDTKHLAITGCSFAGKMALFAGAFDERIALTIAQESGGGGAAAWRVSETLGNVETLGSTSNAWFTEDFFAFANAVPKLPYDHHELMAMVAPRALLVLGNPDFEWLADESGYVSSRAAHEVWKAFGIADRFGFSIVGGHGHCQLPDVQRPEVEAFIDKFILGDTLANTNVQIHPFNETNYKMWYDGWLTGTSTFPVPDTSNISASFYEVECGTTGTNWNVSNDENASNGKFVTIKNGLNNSKEAPSGANDIIEIPITVDREDSYYIFGHVNCESDLDDSIWIKIDDGEFISANGLRTSGWEWVKMVHTELSAGDHTITISYREDGAKLDKLGVTTYIYGPEGMGDNAKNCEM